MSIDINEISKRIVKDFTNLEKRAKNLLKILICGSYKSKEDLKIIEEFRDRQRAKGISGVFLMKDIHLVDEKGDDLEILLHLKLLHIWDVMKEGDHMPIFIIFAGESANMSLGLNAEIQTISMDKKKLDCAYLFKTKNAQLVSHENCFANIKEVKDGNDFMIEAEKIIDSRLNQAKHFYQATEEGQK